MSAGRASRWRGDDGSSLVTFLVLAPVLVMFAELTVLGGRVAVTQGDVDSAAREAARDASIARSAESAATAIVPAVDTALSGKGASCRSRSAVLDPSTNFVAGGSVSVTVTCNVDLSDLGLLNVPGSMQISSTAVEPIDRYRVVE